MTASIACSNQGEGEFCDKNNGSNDCQSELQCIPAPGLSGTLTNSDRCCPIPPAQPTTSACSLNTTTFIDASTGIPDAQTGPRPDAGPAEAGPPEAGVADAPGDVVSVDSAGDAVVSSPDAGHDGGADGSP